MSTEHIAASAKPAPTPARAPASAPQDPREPHLAAAGFGTWEWTLATNVVIVSPATEAIHGLSPGSFGGTFSALSDCIHPDDHDHVIAACFNIAASGTDRFVYYRPRYPADSTDRILTWISPRRAGQQTTALIGVCLSSDAPLNSPLPFPVAPDQLGVVLDGVSDGITVLSPSGDHLYANVAARRLLGIASVAELNAETRAEVRRRFASRDETGKLIEPDQLPTVRALRGEHPDDKLIEFQALDGSGPRWVTSQSTPILDDQGDLRFVVNRLHDLSAERGRQAALADAAARYRILFESSPIPMWVFDLETLRFLAVNDATVQQYGWSREEFLSLSLLDVRPQEDHPAILAKLASLAASPDGLDVAGVWRHRRRDGSEFDAEVSTHAISFDGREARVSLAINVTERTLNANRLERLSNLTAALSAALSPHQVAKVIGQYATSAGADAAAVAALSPADQTVTVLHRTGYPATMPEQSEPFSVFRPSVLAHVIRTGQPIIAPNWREYDEQYPDLMPGRYFAVAAGDGTGIILPLLVDDHAIGAIKMAFNSPRDFSPTLLDELRTIAYLCAQALQRAQLFAAEQAARARAEIEERAARRESSRIAILAEFSRAVAEAGLDFQSVLGTVTHATASHTGDACVLMLLTEEDDLPAVDALHHVDPQIQAALDTALDTGHDTGWLPHLRQAITHIVATGETLIITTPASLATPPAAFVAHRGRDGHDLAAAPGSGEPNGREGGGEGGSAGESDGDVIVYNQMIVPLRARGRITGVMAMFRLVPNQPYADDDLAFFQELGDRAALILDNARLFEEARDAVRARDEFLSAAAHELRTPVTTVKGYAQMLLRAQVKAGLASDRASQFLTAIDESTDRLRVLTDDLLDVSRLRLGQMPLHPRPLDLVNLAQRLVERYETQFDERHSLILVTETGEAVVNADPDRIEQVLTNLLENAAKYSPDGGEISITIAPTPGGVQIAIRDSGIGLPPGFKDSMFEPFKRADNAIRDNVPGLGLGLYICNNIVERHGGHIDAISPGEGRGTTFRLWLPTHGPAPDA